MGRKQREKKKQQLGVDPGTASHRLMRDILWNLIAGSSQGDCYHCGAPMCRETFSIEHKEPWLDSDDPVGLFFDLENISFSHIKCNIKAARKVKSSDEKKAADAAARHRRWYTPEKRHERYLRLERPRIMAAR